MSRSDADQTASPRVSHVRLTVLAILVSAGFIALGWRLYAIQVLGHERYLESARRMQTRTEKVHGYRGDISSRDGVLLARDVINYEIALDPTKIDAENLYRTIRDICQILGASADYRRERLALAAEKKARAKQYLALGERVEKTAKEVIWRTVSEYLRPREMDGLIALSYTRRIYPRGSFMSAVVGVADHENHGTEGLERTMDYYLSSQNGLREVRVGGKMRGQLRAYSLENAYVAPVSGYNVQSTIDSRIQSIVEEMLRWGIRRKGAAAGSCVVMDSTSGDILALANYPTYDPGHFREYPEAEREKRRKNRVVENLYEPGSVAKVFTMAAVLEHGIADLNRPIRAYLPAGVKWEGGRSAHFGSRTVRDVRAHPDMTVEDTLIHSSNIGMSILGLRLGRDRVIEALTRFGIGVRTDVLLPAEAAGSYPPAESWTRFYTTVSVSFGYEVMVTPIQLARGFAALVNGGYLLKPRIVDSIERDGVVRRFPRREVVGRPISEATSQRMRELLRKVIERGTGKYLRIEGFPYGGKTGTARLVKGKHYSNSDHLASFVAFYPVDDPQVVVISMIEKPRRGSHYGAMVSGPVVVEILRRMYNVEEECRLAKDAPGQWKGE